MDRILVVEDRENLRALLVRVLSPEFEVDAVPDGRAAIERLADTSYAAVLTDVRMPGASGDEVLAAARRLPRAPEVVMMSAYAELPAAVAALRAGAYDYLAKPFEPDDIARVVRRAADRWRLVNRTRDLEALVDSAESPILGSSPAIAAVRRMVERVGPMIVTVLLRGESGTGKEVVARELARVYGKGRFVAVNCGAIPEALLEAELFGSARGAFTGATDRGGLFEEADGGTLFLDEIAELAPALQVKLNRALEEGEIRRVGETRPRRVSVRLIAATHRDLEQMVAEGAFREDLYYRLKVVTITLPPLRERPGDIGLLATRFLHVAAARFGTGARRLDPEALASLEAAPWPGNVRELRHAVEAAAVLAEGDTVTVADLPEPLRAPAVGKPGTWRDALARAEETAGRAYLTELLRRTGGNVSRAAAEAAVERETLHRLLKRFGVDPARFRDG